ncbi:MAG: hypothetical protein ACTSXA_11045 [Candidatus Heimdallarchaeota archaeon]
MNEIVATAITLFVLFFLVAQIRFIRRLINRRKNNESISGGLLLSDAFVGCLSCLECCGSVDTVGNYSDPDSDAHLEAFSGKPPDEIEIKRALEDKKRTSSSLTVEEEISKVMSIISKRDKTSLIYISNITTIAKQRIISLLITDPDYIIENEYVINMKMQAKAEPTKLICPECNNPVKSDIEYCTTCGFELKLK